MKATSQNIRISRCISEDGSYDSIWSPEMMRDNFAAA